MEKQIKFSIIIPVFNEEDVIEKVINDLGRFLETELEESYEIIAINDGSEDRTEGILRNIKLENFRYYNSPYNKGYGSALKLGASKAVGKFLIFYDGDGQHNPNDVMELIKEINRYDMVVGSRQGYQGPLWRQPGKKILNIIANYLVSFKIPDLNSGLRIVKKDYFFKFIHLYPEGFSLSTTITLAFLKHGFNVKYTPIKINKRVGKSVVKIFDGFWTIGLILRMIMLFSPLRFFLPISILCFVAGLYSLILDIFIHFNIGDNTILLLISSIIIFSFGLLADQISAVRRELKF